MQQLRKWTLALTLIVGCRTTEGGSGSSDARKASTGPATPTVSEAARAPRTAPNPQATDRDRIADAVLVNYDKSRHKVRVTTTSDGFSVGLQVGGTITATSPNGMPQGQNPASYIQAQGGLVPVAVTLRPGSGWAAGKNLALLLIGEDPGLNGFEKGALALMNPDNTVELAGEWVMEASGPANRPHIADIRFEKAGLTEVLLEADSRSGEGNVGETTFYRVWMRESTRGSEGKWAYDADHLVTSSYHDLSDGGPSLHPGWQSSMSATITPSNEGLVARETWTFKNKSDTKTRVVNRVYHVSGNVITVDTTQPSP